MSGRERRVSPRKSVSMPLQFQIAEGIKVGSAAALARNSGIQPERSPLLVGTIEGETINLSERGIYFRAPMPLQVGEPIEVYFTLPRELTGRSPERVRCNARVVHIDQQMEGGGVCVGAAVERFEPLQSLRDWDN